MCRVTIYFRIVLHCDQYPQTCRIARSASMSDPNSGDGRSRARRGAVNGNRYEPEKQGGPITHAPERINTTEDQRAVRNRHPHRSNERSWPTSCQQQRHRDGRARGAFHRTQRPRLECSQTAGARTHGGNSTTRTMDPTGRTPSQDHAEASVGRPELRPADRR